jgi:hypothetical protein
VDCLPDISFGDPTRIDRILDLISFLVVNGEGHHRYAQGKPLKAWDNQPPFESNQERVSYHGGDAQICIGAPRPALQDK